MCVATTLGSAGVLLCSSVLARHRIGFAVVRELVRFLRTTLISAGRISDDFGCEDIGIMFSVTIAAATRKRYLYLVQKETGTGLVVLILLFDRATTGEDSDGLQLPPSGAWLRAVVDGAVYVLASDLVLNRKAITAWIGGREPPTAPARPPYT
jgi:hypothetical protein